MAVRTPNGIFTHIPRTGGNWVSTVLRRLHLAIEGCAPHASMDDIRKDPELAEWHGLDAFAFVRHPVPWYRSYWAYKMRAGWIHAGVPLDECRSDDFNDFIRKCVARHPGHLSAYYRSFTAGAKYVGRHEALPESLVLILDALGERFDPGVVYATPRENDSDPGILARAQYDLGTLKLLVEAEADALSAFGYAARPAGGPA